MPSQPLQTSSSFRLGPRLPYSCGQHTGVPARFLSNVNAMLTSPILKQKMSHGTKAMAQKQLEMNHLIDFHFGISNFHLSGSNFHFCRQRTLLVKVRKSNYEQPLVDP